MSEHGSGPPPPPSGGNSEGPYGQQPYGTPPPQPQYGAPQPEYNAPPPQPQFGAPPPQPQYGAPPPQPQYGAPPPQPQYGAPQSQFGAPPPGYGAAPYGAAPYGAAPYGAPGMFGPPASMGKRLLARIVDGILVGAVLSILGAVLVGGASTQVEVNSAGEMTSGSGAFVSVMMGYLLIALVVTLCYEVVLIALRGATLGKQLMKIRVVREMDGQVPGWGPSLIRWVLPQVGGSICGLISLAIYLSPFFDNTGRNQGWHDKVAKTLVVEG